MSNQKCPRESIFLFYSKAVQAKMLLIHEILDTYKKCKEMIFVRDTFTRHAVFPETWSKEYDFNKLIIYSVLK